MHVRSKGLYGRQLWLTEVKNIIQSRSLLLRFKYILLVKLGDSYLEMENPTVSRSFELNKRYVVSAGVEVILWISLEVEVRYIFAWLWCLHLKPGMPFWYHWSLSLYYRCTFLLKNRTASFFWSLKALPFLIKSCNMFITKFTLEFYILSQIIV